MLRYGAKKMGNPQIQKTTNNSLNVFDTTTDKFWKIDKLVSKECQVEFPMVPQNASVNQRKRNLSLYEKIIWGTKAA